MPSRKIRNGARKLFFRIESFIFSIPWCYCYCAPCRAGNVRRISVLEQLDCLELGRSDGFSLGRPAFFDRLSSQEQYFQDTTSNTSTPLHAEASTAIASSWCQQSRPAEGDSDWRCRNSNLTNDPTIFCKILGRSSGAVGLRCVQSGPGLCVAFFCRWLPPPLAHLASASEFFVAPVRSCRAEVVV